MTVVSTTEHTVVYKLHAKGLPMNVAYRDVKFIPNNEIARHLAALDDDERQNEVREDDSIGPVVTLMTTPVGNSAKDIDLTPYHRVPSAPGVLQKNEAQVLRDLKDIIGGDQVNRSRLEGAPAWVLQKALHA